MVKSAPGHSSPGKQFIYGRSVIIEFSPIVPRKKKVQCPVSCVHFEQNENNLSTNYIYKKKQCTGKQDWALSSSLIRRLVQKQKKSKCILEFISRTELKCHSLFFQTHKFGLTPVRWSCCTDLRQEDASPRGPLGSTMWSVSLLMVTDAGATEQMILLKLSK